MLRQGRFESCDERGKIRRRQPLWYGTAKYTRRRITEPSLRAGTASLPRYNENALATAGCRIADEQTQVLMRLRLGHPVQIQARLNALRAQEQFFVRAEGAR